MSVSCYNFPGILAIIFIALVIMAILIGRYLARHKGEYLTQEDKGAESALDPDSAVVHSTTGHQVQKKREWFIWYEKKHCKSTHTATNICLNNFLQLSLHFIRINYLCLNLNSHRAKTFSNVQVVLAFYCFLCRSLI